MKEVLIQQADDLRSPGLGSLLKELRAFRHLTQAKAAEAAGLSRHSLIRWEQGSNQPRLPELNAVLDALEASAEQRTRALALIRAPRAIQTLRAEQPPPSDTDNSTTAWIFTPETGDLLRTMRLRQGMTQEYVAEQMMVRRNSVTRWETGERLPSDAHLEELLDLLGALPAERKAISNGLLLPSGLTGETAKSFETLMEHYTRLNYYIVSPDEEALKDLEYLRLEKAFADLVPYHPEARHYLINTYSFHANWLMESKRYKEAGQYAERVLEAAYNEALPSREWRRSILTVAQCAVHSNSNGQSCPERGIEMLQGWLPQVADSPEFAAWMLSDMSRYMVQAGRISAALETITRSCRVAQRCDNSTELRLRRVDRAEMLLLTAQPHDAQLALDLLPSDVSKRPAQRLREKLCWSKGLLQTGEVSEAKRWLERAQEEVQTHNLDAAPVNALAQRFA